MEENKKISVLMSVYKNDNPEWVALSIDSVLNQTLPPSEVLIIVDGPVPEEITRVLNEKKEQNSIIKIHPLKQNIGLGRVLALGVPLCENELIARMDSDDICKPNRFETELKFMTENNLDLVGSNIEEFCDDPEKIVSIREVPSTLEEIKEYIKGRNPFNHVTVMFKKSACLKAGNYQDMHYCEDYYLWVRMMLSGAKMANIQETLVKVRMNEATFRRRGGLKYFKSQKRLFKYMKKNGVLNWFEYVKTLSTRFIVHVLMPGKLKERIYKKHLRKNTNGKNTTENKSK